MSPVGAARAGVFGGVAAIPDSEFDHLWWGPSISDISTYPDESGSLNLSSNGAPALSDINGNQSADYDGADDDHATGSALSLGSNDEWTIAVVYNMRDDGTNNRLFQTGSGDSSATGVGFGVRFDTNNYNIAHSGSDFINAGTPGTGDEVAVCSFDGTNVYLDVNKTEIVGGQSLNSPDMSGSKTVIGQRGDGSVYTNGTIGAVGFEAGFADASRRDALSDDLAAEFDITI